MSFLLDLLAFVAGFAVCWLAKDRIIATVAGTEALIKTLEARAASLRAAL
jgi:hypothetical protein